MGMKVSFHNPIEVKSKGRGKTKASKVPGGHESLRFEYECNNSTLDVSFRRTVRVPDNQRSYDLPPDGGAFPLFSVNRYRQQLPVEIGDKGGVFLPMYQREAMWIDFTCEKPFAVKIYVGGINAISGEPRDADLGTLLRRSTALDRGESIQGYLVTDEQYWIDGIAKRNGTVMQFVATSEGTGYSVEAQVTGFASVRGIQLEVVPCRKRYITVRIQDGSEWIRYSLRKDEEFKQVMDAHCAHKCINLESCRFILDGILIWQTCTLEYLGIKDGDVIDIHTEQVGGGPEDHQPCEAKAAVESIQEMAIAPGGLIKQTIVQDTVPAEEWDTENAIMTNISLINASSFKQITGFNAPRTPITATTYAKQGLPFFEMYREPSGIKGDFKNLQSAGELDRGKNENVEAHAEEKDLDFATVDISKRGSSFVPVEEMERRAKRLRISNDL